MNLPRILTIGITVAGLMVFAFSALAQPTAERVFSDVDYLPGIPIKITINVTGVLKQDFTVIENVPLGWEVLAISKGGERIENQITWKQTTSAIDKAILYYKLIPPTTVGENAQFQGTINNQSIIGASTLNRGYLKPVGVFENHVNMWEVSFNKVEFEEPTGVYRITSGLSSHNVFGGRFLYSEVYGDALLEAFAKAENPKETFYAMANLVIFDSLDADCLWFTIEIKVNGNGGVAWGKNMSFNGGPDVNSRQFNGGMRIIREQDRFSAYYYDTISEDWKFLCETKIEMTDPVYIGLFTHCGNGESTVGTFRNVTLELFQKKSSAAGWMLYP